MDFVDEIMKGIFWITMKIAGLIGIGLNKLMIAGFRSTNSGGVATQLTKAQQAEKDETRRIAECRDVVLAYANLQGHIAREVMTREELEEKIDSGITADELRTELHERIEKAPGIILGVHRDIDFLPIKLPFSQMARHTYIIGKSGSGKTNLIRAMLLQNIYLGHGVGVIAPEAELLTDEIIPYIPDNRIDDVVYINPADSQYPISINPLYADEEEEIGEKVEDMVTVFKRIVGDTGARMDHILNNALYALIERKNATLLDVSRLLTDPTFQKEIIATTKDEQTREFFATEYPSYQKGANLPITTRLGMFTRRKAIRSILCQPGQGFNFRKAMDEGKILLFNLSDGILGAQTAQILGQIIVSKIQLAAMSRADTPAANRRPFYLYMDEFQAFTEVNAKSYEIMLSRARKYRLNLILANQHTHQLSQDLLHAILGNVATIIAFSVGRDDAAKLAREYMLDAGIEMLELPSEELLRLKIGEAWGKIGKSIFPLKTKLVDQNPDHTRAQYIIERSRLNYGYGNGKRPDLSTDPDYRELPPHDTDPPDDDEQSPDPTKVF